MSSSWRRNWGNVKTFLGNSMGGLRGGSNMAAWAVAGTLAYILWVKPSQDLKRLQLEKEKEMAMAKEKEKEKENTRPEKQTPSLSSGQR